MVPPADDLADRSVVWDLPVRLGHWLLVALLGGAWWSGTHHQLDWHRRAGYAILALLVFRLAWGVVGHPTARFASFVRGPRTVVAYARSLVGVGTSLRRAITRWAGGAW